MTEDNKQKTCEIHIYSGEQYPSKRSCLYVLCGKPAKYITPPDPINKKVMFVCGTHRRSVDSLHKRIGSINRCKKITLKHD